MENNDLGHNIIDLEDLEEKNVNDEKKSNSPKQEENLENKNKEIIRI